jgi:hypothetical protein
MTIAEWLLKMTIGDAFQLAAWVIASFIVTVLVMRPGMKRVELQSTVSPERAKMFRMAGFLTGLLILVVSLYLLRNHITVSTPR